MGFGGEYTGLSTLMSVIFSLLKIKATLNKNSEEFKIHKSWVENTWVYLSILFCVAENVKPFLKKLLVRKSS